MPAAATGAPLAPSPVRTSPPPPPPRPPIPPPTRGRAGHQSLRCAAARSDRAGRAAPPAGRGSGSAGSASRAGRATPPASRGSGSARAAPPPPPPTPPPPPPARGTDGRQEAADSDDDAAPAQVSYVRERVNIQSSNRPLRSLVDMVDSGTLNLEPEYQRDFVWDTKRCMGLLKTLYEGLPMPAVMLFQQYVEGLGNRHDVVDGKQRLITLYCFVRGSNARFPRAPIAFEMNPKEEELAPLLNKKKFKDLTREEQNNILDYDVQVQSIPEGTPPRLVFRIYENINAGAVGHSDMQLRRAPYHGSYIRLLDRMVGGEGKASALFRELAELKEEEQCAMQAQELVLRFFALRRAAIPSFKRPFKAPMKTFLNKELASTDANGREVALRLEPEEERRMAQVFESTVGLLSTLGLKAVAEAAMKAGGPRVIFRRWGGTTVAGTVWDTTLVGLSLALDSWPKVSTYTRNAAALQEGYGAMLGSEEWKNVAGSLTQKSLMARLALFEEMVIRPAMGDEAKL